MIPTKKIIPIAIDRSNKFYALKFKSISDDLTNLFDKKYFYPATQNILNQIVKLNSQQLLSYGSDYFWLSIHRLYSSIKNQDELFLKNNINYFLINAFDSFYELLEDSSFISFYNGGDESLLCVKQNFTVPFTQNTICKLTKNSDYIINIELNKVNFTQIVTKYDINLRDLPVHHMLQSTTYYHHNGLKILYQKHQSLFEEEYYEQCNGNPIWGYLLNDKIDSAFNIIKTVDIQLYNRICSIVKYIIPLGNSDDIHLVSFSSAMLKNNIFLSVYMEGPFLVESIIHEFSHCELHYVQDTILLANEDVNKKYYYSPWRPDARPLTALIHALYVFHSIIDFFNKYIALEIYKEFKIQVIDRVELIIHQIILGLKQIKENCLTDFSKELLHEIRLSTQAIAEELKINLLNPPIAINEHKAQWLIDNPNIFINEH